MALSANAPAPPSAPSPFSDDEVKVIDYIAGRILAGEGSGAADPDTISRATGVAPDSIRAIDPGRLRRGVLERLAAPSKEEPSGCSLEGSLTGADEEKMAIYRADKARDHLEFNDWTAPDFILPVTSGGEMALSDLAGRPVALAFVSGHCSHSLEILRRISALRTGMDLGEMAIVGVYVNSGSPEDVHAWTQYLNIDFPLLVAETPEIADRYGFHTVPSIYLIDGSRKVRSLLVGEKGRDELAAALAGLSGMAARQASSRGAIGLTD
jgi:peroxiredoxin